MDSADGDGPERPGRSLLLRALAGAVVIALCTGAVVATAVLLQVKSVADALRSAPALATGGQITPAQAGQPQTFLVIGSDKRALASSADRLSPPHSDTLILIRMDPQAGVTSMLSIPRDLRVRIRPRRGPASTQKINAAFSIGGVPLALLTIKRLLHVPINHVIDLNFKGFRRVISAIGCVYVDVDRHYYNDNSTAAYGQGYATINVQPGYQRLCDQTALDYVRYRHTDSDFSRVARQQDFIRQAKNQISANDLISHRAQIISSLGGAIQTDIRSTSDVLRVAELVAFSVGHGVRQVPFAATPGPSFVTATAAQLRANAAQLLHPLPTPHVHRSSSPRGHHGHRRARHRSPAPVVTTPALASDVALAQAMAPRLPFRLIYPLRRVQLGLHTDLLRVYSLRDQQRRLHRAYKVVISTGYVGEFAGLEGTDWVDPPILTHPSQRIRLRGRTLELFNDGTRLRLVAWRPTPHTVYWLSNTLLERFSRAQMLAMVFGARPVSPKS